MTKSAKRGSAMQELAHTHLYATGSGFYANPAINRERDIIQILTNTLIDMALNRFRWTGIPETWDQRFLETQLLVQGLAVVYWDKDYDSLLALRGSGMGYVNMIDNPVSFTVIGPGASVDPTTDVEASLFNTKTLGAYQAMVHRRKGEEYPAKDKCVPVWNNYTRTGDLPIIRMYASRLAMIDRTLEINTKAARRNKVIKGTPNTQLSMVNFARQLDQGDELLQVTGVMEDMQFIEALDLGVTPDAYEKLGVHRTRVWNECMIMLGIDSANQEKKERMVAAEVSANDSQADAIKLKSLKARREAVDQINKIWDLNIKVEFETDAENEEKLEKAAELERSTTDANRSDDRENGDK